MPGGKDDFVAYSPYTLHEDRITRVEDHLSHLVTNLTASMARVESKLEDLDEVKGDVKGMADKVEQIQLSVADNESRLKSVENELAERREDRKLFKKTALGIVSALIITGILAFLGIHGAGAGAP